MFLPSNRGKNIFESIIIKYKAVYTVGADVIIQKWELYWCITSYWPQNPYHNLNTTL